MFMDKRTIKQAESKISPDPMGSVCGGGIMQYKSFGDFMAQKRTGLGMTIREMAEALNCTPTFVFDVEKDKRYPPEVHRLELLASALGLSREEQRLMYDLAGEGRGTIAPDLPVYIQDHPFVVEGLRESRDLGAVKEDWDKFVEYLKKNRERK